MDIIFVASLVGLFCLPLLYIEKIISKQAMIALITVCVVSGFSLLWRTSTETTMISNQLIVNSVKIKFKQPVKIITRKEISYLETGMFTTYQYFVE